SLRHRMILINCLSFDNKVKGFDQNNNRGSMTLLNCTAYRNGSYNFAIPGFIRATSTLTVENCISLGSSGVTLAGVPGAIVATNSWTVPFTGAVTGDFLSIDTTGTRGPRKADGSLPDLQFMHLASSSPFVDAGTNVGLPYAGSKPDLGCFETAAPTDVKKQNCEVPQEFLLFQNFPNPFNPTTTIGFRISTVAHVRLSVYDMLGRRVTLLLDEIKPAGAYSVRWNASGLAAGIYFYRLEAGLNVSTKKLILLQ
ncbi:MAG TPA: T9SS type A sorting domain-containing protein, partial [Bacteroidota bacterium]|nr:T9SS type A sorting domain-containing protein [Bacteroidota bacterium]